MSMKVVQLTSDYEMKPFDCGDTELNGFLLTLIPQHFDLTLFISS